MQNLSDWAMQRYCDETKKDNGIFSLSLFFRSFVPLLISRVGISVDSSLVTVAQLIYKSIALGREC